MLSSKERRYASRCAIAWIAKGEPGAFSGLRRGSQGTRSPSMAGPLNTAALRTVAIESRTTSVRRVHRRSTTRRRFFQIELLCRLEPLPILRSRYPESPCMNPESTHGWKYRPTSSTLIRNRRVRDNGDRIVYGHGLHIHRNKLGYIIFRFIL